MANLKGSKTESNLRTAFAGESQARGRYLYFAIKAKEEGFGDAARYFEETAVNEQEHAKLWFKFLGGIGGTAENLQTAIAGERQEHAEMYPAFAKTAREEGFDEIAERFEQIAAIEKTHEEHFRKLAAFLEKSESRNDWKCDNCGYIISAKSAPQSCPVCGNTDLNWSGYRAFNPI
jgi:rubrerythrin